MHVVALPAGLQRLVRAALHREPWRNGRGWTSTVATHQVAGQLVWRVSIAEIQAASPFSRFPALDRIAVLIQGGPLSLVGSDRRWALVHPGDEARFAGEADIVNTAPTHEALIWNVMSHRDAGRAEVHGSQAQVLSLPADGQTLVWVLEGSYELVGPNIPPGVLIDAGEGLHWSGDGPGPTLEPVSAQARLLCTRLWG